MSKKRYRLRGPAPAMSKGLHQDLQMYGGIQGALPYRQGVLVWPTLDERNEVSSWDRISLIAGARFLRKNAGVIRKVIADIALFIGHMKPIPRTTDEEWNKLARKAYRDRTGNPGLFDMVGKKGIKGMMQWAEKRRITDGDVFCVFCRMDDGGAGLSWYTSTQIQTPSDAKQGEYWDQGVRLNEQGRVIEYGLKKADGSFVRIPASAGFLYHHETDPHVSRGETELIHAIRHGVDIAETRGYVKASVKLAASVGFVETRANEKDIGGMGAQFGQQKDQPIEEKNPPQSIEIMEGGGTRVLSLEPGRDLKAIYDQRPSPNVMEFIRDLLAEIANGCGLDAEVVYDIAKLGSGGVRFSLEKLQKWIEERQEYPEKLYHRIYVYTIACEIASGRLRPCKDPNWSNVEWVAGRNMTIDVGRTGSLAINLMRECLADADQWCLGTTGLTADEIIERRAAYLAKAHRVANDYGVTMEELFPGAIGATHQPHEVNKAPEETLNKTDSSDL